jgi:glycosyltransferase involved in cell wall biosynthesis
MSLTSEGSKERKLKLLVCVYACLLESGSPVSGGEATLGWSLVRQLARFHDVWALTATSNRAGIEAELQRQPVSNLRFHYVDLRGWARPLLRFPGGLQLYAYIWQLRVYFAARKLHRELNFDAFHHVTFANDWMASFIGALLPVPFLRGPCGGAHRTPDEFLREFSFGALFWERFRSFGQWVLRHDPFFVLGQRRAAAILVCNREAAEAIPVPLRHKVKMFPVNGISPEDLRILGGETGQTERGVEPIPARKTSPPTSFEVLYAGKLLGLKGISLAVRAFALFAERHSDARFSIVGDGPERARLEFLIQRLKVGYCVDVNRWMPRAEVLSLMRDCDVFLFPSLRDGGGAVVVEAMAAGKPVVCMDIAGPGMHITEECGIKIPARSPHETVQLMALALERLYQDRELCCRMGQAARSRADHVYAWDRLGERLQKIYEEDLRLSSFKV